MAFAGSSKPWSGWRWRGGGLGSIQRYQRNMSKSVFLVCLSKPPWTKCWANMSLTYQLSLPIFCCTVIYINHETESGDAKKYLFNAKRMRWWFDKPVFGQLLWKFKWSWKFLKRFRNNQLFSFLRIQPVYDGEDDMSCRKPKLLNA